MGTAGKNTLTLPMVVPNAIWSFPTQTPSTFADLKTVACLNLETSDLDHFMCGKLGTEVLTSITVGTGADSERDSASRKAFSN